MMSLQCRCGSLLHLRPSEADDTIICTCRQCLKPFLVRISVQPGMTASSDILEDAGLQDPATAEPDSLMSRVLAMVPAAADDLPVLPEISQRVLAAIYDPVMDMHDLASLIGEDAVLSARVMQLANSVAFGGAHRIAALPEACARLGLKRIAHVVHLTSQADVYRSRNRRNREFLAQLWRHNIATAYCVDAISVWSRLGSSSSTFLAGLVHDVGKLILFDVIQNQYTGSIGRLEDSPELLLEAIADYYTLAGLHAVQKWALPNEVALAVYYQVDPAKVEAGAGRQLAMAVQAGDAMATFAGFGLADGEDVDLSAQPAVQGLELDVAAMEEYCAGLDELLEPVLESFGPE